MSPRTSDAGSVKTVNRNGGSRIALNCLLTTTRDDNGVLLSLLVYSSSYPWYPTIACDPKYMVVSEIGRLPRLGQECPMARKDWL